MSLLIDGYNLMYGADIVGRGSGPGGLERSRLALLNLVAAALDDTARRSTTVVFDAAMAPPGLPDVLDHRGMTVRFARHYADADELIEELIQADSSPRRLTVVSSDHRVQRAAKRRRATAIDADVWFGQLRASVQQPPKPASPAKPSQAKLSDLEVEYWLRVFDVETGDDRPKPEDVFPPGYGDDIKPV